MGAAALVYKCKVYFQTIKNEQKSGQNSIQMLSRFTLVILKRLRYNIDDVGGDCTDRVYCDAVEGQLKLRWGKESLCW